MVIRTVWSSVPWLDLRLEGSRQPKQLRTGFLVKQVYTLDPEFTAEKLDGEKVFPCLNTRPDLNKALLDALPKIIYHSCDRRTMMQIIEYGMVPGGWPKSTGRAHNFFNTMHPWDANLKKVAGTRAGKQNVSSIIWYLTQSSCSRTASDFSGRTKPFCPQISLAMSI